MRRDRSARSVLKFRLIFMLFGVIDLLQPFAIFAYAICIWCNGKTSGMKSTTIVSYFSKHQETIILHRCLRSYST